MKRRPLPQLTPASVLGVSSSALAALTLVGSASAHHSYAQFDACSPVTIEGKIEQVSWTNPHIVLTLDADDSVTYRVEWLNMFTLTRAGLSTESLNAGDRVVLTGARHRDPDVKIITLLSEVRRPSDGWLWARARERERPAACDA